MGILDTLLRVLALAVAALIVAADRLPEGTAWGIRHYTVLPLPAALLMACLLVVMAAGPINDAIRRGAAHVWDRLPGRSHPRLWFAALALISGAPFWVWRIQHLRWGDAEFIVKALAYTGADRPIWTIYNWQAPLTIYLHARLWLLLRPLTGVGVGTLYAITSVLAGIGFVYVLLCLSNRLGRDRLEKTTIFGLVATTGSIQLFFGYVENYTIMSTGILLTLYLAVRCMKHEVSPAWPSLTLAVTNSFHPSTIVLWPAMLYLGWRLSTIHPARHDSHRLAVWLRLMLPPVLVFLALAAFMTAGGHGPKAMLMDDRPGGADGIPFVPLFTVTTEWQRYTMFSLAHLIEWVNEHFLISPFGIVMLAGTTAALIGRRVRSRTVEPREGDDGGIATFLTIASLAYLLLTFVWNPDYGMRKDWDLFAPSAFVYTLLAATIWLRSHDLEAPARKLGLARTATLVIAAAAVHTAAWVNYNSMPW